MASAVVIHRPGSLLRLCSPLPGVQTFAVVALLGCLAFAAQAQTDADILVSSLLSAIQTAAAALPWQAGTVPDIFTADARVALCRTSPCSWSTLRERCVPCLLPASLCPCSASPVHVRPIIIASLLCCASMWRLNQPERGLQFYSCASTGSGLPANLRGGGPASIGCQKATLGSAVGDLAAELAANEMTHVRSHCMFLIAGPLLPPCS